MSQVVSIELGQLAPRLISPPLAVQAHPDAMWPGAGATAYFSRMGVHPSNF